MYIDRQEGRMPSFTRTSWVNDALRNQWQPRLQKISQAWSYLEWASVAEGLRDCAILQLSPNDLMDSAESLVKFGLSIVPHDISGAGTAAYGSSSSPVETGKPVLFRSVVGKMENLSSYLDGVNRHDDAIIGQSLGYPQCCTTFFNRVWSEQGCMDTSWATAMNTKAVHAADQIVEVTDWYPYSNILWRWLGVRAVWHLPCSFQCDPSHQLAQCVIELGKVSGFSDEMDWLSEILSWPIEWSAYHGIAEIKTPILKISANTDITASKHCVQLLSDRYPDNGPTGLNFPYQGAVKKQHTVSVKFQKGLENEIPKIKHTLPRWYALDNGFTSIKAMEEAHQPIIDAVQSILAEDKPPTIIDFGCGNGALLKSIVNATDASTKVVGIEIDKNKIDHTSAHNTTNNEHFIHSNIFTCTDLLTFVNDADICLFMPGRILEAKTEETVPLLNFMHDHCRNIVLYAYGSWLTDYGDLAGLIEKCAVFNIESQPNNVTAIVSVKTDLRFLTLQESPQYQ